jgi:hypothetical protein
MLIVVAPSASADLRTNARAYLSALNVFFNVSTSAPTTLLNMSMAQSISAAVQNYAASSGVFLSSDSVSAISNGPPSLSGISLAETPPAAPASNQPLVIGLSVGFCILFVIAIVVFFIYRRRRANNRLNTSNRHMLSSESFEVGVLPLNPLWVARETKSKEQADAFMEFPSSDELDEFGNVNPMRGRSIGVQTTFSSFNVDSLAPNALPVGAGERFDFDPTSSVVSNGASKRQLTSQKSFSSTLKRFFFSSNNPFSTRRNTVMASQRINPLNGPSEDLSALAAPSNFAANPMHAMRLKQNGGPLSRSLANSQQHSSMQNIFNIPPTSSEFQGVNPMRSNLTARSSDSIGAQSPSRRALSSDLDTATSPIRKRPSWRATIEEEEEGTEEQEHEETSDKEGGNQSDEYDEETAVGMSPRKLQQKEQEREDEEPVAFSPQITPSRQKSQKILDLASKYEKVILERKNSSYLPSNSSKSSTRLLAQPAPISPWDKKSTRFMLPVNKVVEPIHEEEEAEEEEDVEETHEEEEEEAPEEEEIEEEEEEIEEEEQEEDEEGDEE